MLYVLTSPNVYIVYIYSILSVFVPETLYVPNFKVKMMINILHVESTCKTHKNTYTYLYTHIN